MRLAGGESPVLVDVAEHQVEVESLADVMAELRGEVCLCEGDDVPESVSSIDLIGGMKAVHDDCPGVAEGDMPDGVLPDVKQKGRRDFCIPYPLHEKVGQLMGRAATADDPVDVSVPAPRWEAVGMFQEAV